MRYIKSFLLALSVSVLILLGIGYFLESTFTIKREITIKAEAEKVFSYAGDLKKWPDWTAWNKEKYPSLNLCYGGPEKGVGAWQSWKGDRTESGKVTITSWQPSTRLEFDVVLEENFNSKGEIICKNQSLKGTKVIWTMKGDVGNNLISRYFILFADRFIAADIEKNLSNLKKLCEKE